MTGKTIAERIAEYGLGLKFPALPPDVVHEAKRRLIDSFACALGSLECPPVKAALKASPSVKEGLSASVIGRDIQAPPDCAAFANGVLIRYLDYNDTYLSKEPAHPSDNIAAALAAAEAGGKGGEGLITSIVAAYEVQCALCDAASLRERGFDHVTYGAFSSVLAASMLLGLNRQETVHALGIAGVSSVALRQTRAGELSMWKGAAFANAARDAVFYAVLAKGGMTGPSPVFEGEFGFFNLVSGAFVLPPFAGEGGSDARFKMLETYIKYYPAEYHAQSAISAAAEISAAVDDIRELRSITVSTFKAAYDIIGKGDEKRRPKTRETADHSLAFCVAAALLDGTVTVETFSAERLDDERLLRLVDKIRIVRDKAFDGLYPAAMPNRIEAVLASGDVLSREVIYPKGHPKNPLTDAEVEEKFRALSGWYLTDKEASKVLKRLWAIDECEDMRDFMSVFAAKGGKKR